ncbi:MAG: hypothetical protein HKN88_05130 [Gammaproteobacteria bacterium]|nr:sulfotransferase [Gammaproteobacteria bacterium]NNC97436.1 hypothetical protein [Gammaproteobacteria bacterium]NNM13909.1 hypothetical protein [Gammaproteobacteria bacterium]
MKINLVSSPRNRSTLLMYAFAQRADTRVVDEPYYAHYLSQSEVTHPGHAEVMAAQANDIQSAHHELLKAPGEHLFIKNMAHHYREADFKYLLDFTNILYIRNPRAIIRSYSKVINSPTVDDVGIQQVERIFNFLKTNGQRILVLDSDALVTNPEKVLRSLCRALTIPFDKAMLSWEPGPKPYDGVWANYWYHNVHNSTGFKPKDHAGEEYALPQTLEALAVRCMPAYETLKQHSLTIE